MLVLPAITKCLHFMCLIWNGKQCGNAGFDYYIRNIFAHKKAEVTGIWRITYLGLLHVFYSAYIKGDHVQGLCYIWCRKSTEVVNIAHKLCLGNLIHRG